MSDVLADSLVLQQAIQNYAKGYLDEAENLFRQEISCNPLSAKSFYFLGLIALDKQIADEACRLLYQATLLDPNNKDFRYSLGVALQQDNKIEEAISVYHQLDDMPEAFNNLGNIYLAKKDFTNALVNFDKALALDPQMVWALVNKSILARLQGDFLVCESLLQKALRIDDTFIPALYQFSIFYRLQTKPEKALEVIQKALKITDKEASLWVEYGKVLLLKNLQNEALSAFDTAISQDRYCQDAYFEKALLLEKNLPNKAEEVYHNLLSINPKHIEGLNNFACFLYRQKRTTEALETYRNVIIIDPENMLAVFNLAIILEDLGEVEEATGLYFNVLSHHCFEKDVHIRLSAILPRLYLKDKKEALRYVKGWALHFPDNPFALHTKKALEGQLDSQENDYAYTTNLYNAFAESYENKMKNLACHIPEKIATELLSYHFENALDLGCGTGLCGKLLKPFCEKIIGIDSSLSMVERAKEKQVYDNLEVIDIVDFLTHTESYYDLIVSADVFCYMGKLDDVFSLIDQHLSSKGLFVFTTEKSQQNIQISPTGRYQHSKEYVESLLKENKLVLIQEKEIALRKEEQGVCEGYLFIVQKQN